MTLKKCVLCGKFFESEKGYKICKECCKTKVIDNDVTTALNKHAKVILNLSLNRGG